MPVSTCHVRQGAINMRRSPRLLVLLVLGYLLLAQVTLAGAAVHTKGGPATAGSPLTDESVPLYGLFEAEITNPNTYANPFDFDEVELTATFTHSSSGRSLDFYGFHDGDGQGGQEGDVWKLRFMPDRTGTWEYAYSWSDGTTGGSGSFDVVDSGLPGPIRQASGNSKLWSTERGGTFIPYYVSVGRPYDLVDDSRIDPFLDYIGDTLGAKGVAIILVNRVWYECQDNENCSPTGLSFAMANWNKLDEFMDELGQRELGANVMFYSDDSAKPQFSGRSSLEQSLLKYTVARLAGYPFVTFDSGIDILEYRSDNWSDWFAQELYRLDPWDHPVGSRHGGGSGDFSCGNCTYDSRGDVHPDYSDILRVMQATTKPVFFTDRWREDYQRGNFDSERIRQIMWHAGVAGGPGFMIGGRNGSLRLSDYDSDLDSPRQLRAFSEFWHETVVDWRAFESCDSITDNRACFGERGEEYVIYLENSDPAEVDLSGAPGTFSVEWLNPREATYSVDDPVSASGAVSLPPPADDGGDWVLHLTRIGPTSVIEGDLNTDGAVNILDVQLCVNVVLGAETDPAIMARADVNDDRSVNILDVQNIVNIILGV